jgi:hypothetical protein
MTILDKEILMKNLTQIESLVNLIMKTNPKLNEEEVLSIVFTLLSNKKV